MGTFTPINIGQFANDNTGDSLRTAFSKINTNYSNMSLVANVLANASPVIIAALNNISVPDIPNSLVVRDNTGSGFFANLTANGSIFAGSLIINDEYYLPMTPGLYGQSLISNGNGTTSWANISSGGGGGSDAPGLPNQLIVNQNGLYGALSGITSNGSSLSVTTSVSTNLINTNEIILNGNIIFGPPSHITISNSSPIINLLTSTNQIITLTANIDSSIILNGIDGREYTFLINQSTGNNYWTWPNNFLGAGNINADNFNINANSYSTQKFLFSEASNIYYAITPLVTVGI
jgi:hypothetical protein